MTVTVADIAEGLARGQRLLALDVGKRTIGLAISDSTLIVATPLTTVRRTKLVKDLDAVRAVVEKRGVGGFIVGLPLNMDGSEGPRVQSVRQFAKDLAAAIPLPLAFWDERLSTVAVTRTLLESDRSRKRRAEVVDKMAAAYFLQGALDSLPRR